MIAVSRLVNENKNEGEMGKKKMAPVKPVLEDKAMGGDIPSSEDKVKDEPEAEIKPEQAKPLKPVVPAVLWTGKNPLDVGKLLGDQGLYFKSGKIRVILHGPETALLEVGQYLVKCPDGSYLIMTAAAFEALFDMA